MQKKDKTVSIARGIAIIAMVVGHAVPHDTFLATFIYKWHMPLFFFFSGYFFNVDKYSFGKFAYRKIKSLYVPFVIWSLLLLSIHNVLIKYHISDGNIIDLHTFKLLAFRIIFQMRQSEPLLGTFWFLVQLFFINFLAYFIFYVKKKIENRWIGMRYVNIIDVLIIFMLLVASVLFRRFDQNIPRLDIFIFGDFCYITLLSLSFFVIGNILSKNTFWKHRLSFVISCIVIVFLGNSFHEMIDLKARYIPIYFFIAICGINFVYIISKFIGNKFRYINITLAYVGDKSLNIMVLHLIAFKIVSYMIILDNNLSIDILSSHPVIENVQWYWSFIYILMGVVLPLFLEKIYSCFKCSFLLKHIK